MAEPTKREIRIGALQKVDEDVVRELESDAVVATVPGEVCAIPADVHQRRLLLRAAHVTLKALEFMLHVGGLEETKQEGRVTAPEDDEQLP